MKNLLISSVVVLSISLFSCKKEALPNPTENAITPNAIVNYGVTVSDSRLKFTSEGFKKAIEADLKETDALISYIRSLKGFTSQAVLNTGVQAKSANSCNCQIDPDDFMNEVIDSYYMFEVDDWVVKVDACAQNYYALDVAGLTAAQRVVMVDELKECAYSTSTRIHMISFDDEIYDQLLMKRCMINGEPVPEELARCRDVACSDRIDQSWEYQGSVRLPQGQVGPPSPLDVPRFYLTYDKGLTKGKIRCWVQQTPTTINFWQWQLRVDHCSFQEVCGSGHSFNANTWTEYAPNWSKDNRGGTPYFVTVLWHDKRVKAGMGNYKFMFAHNTDPMADGTWMNLVF